MLARRNFRHVPRATWRRFLEDQRAFKERAMLTAKTKKLLDDVAKKPETSGLAYDGDEALSQADRWLRLHRQNDDVEEKMAEAREFLIEVLQVWHEKVCRQRGAFEPTVLVEATAGTLQIVFKAQFSKIPAERGESLQKELGDEYKAAFDEIVSLKIRPAVAKDPEQINVIIRELAKLPQFAEWFESETVLTPTEAFAERLATDAKLRRRLGIKQTITLSDKAAA